MVKKITMRNIKLKTVFWYFFALFCIFSTIINFVLPFRRKEIFGLGLPSPMVIYINQDEHFSIAHPKTWSVLYMPEGIHGDVEEILMISPRRSFPFPYIPQLTLARKVFEGNDLYQVAAWGQIRKQLYDIYQSISLESTVMDGTTGLLREYTWGGKSLFGNSVIQCIDWYLLQRNTGYDISLCAASTQWDKVSEVFYQMINSFQTW